MGRDFSITPEQLFSARPARPDVPAHWPKIMIECPCGEMFEEDGSNEPHCSKCREEAEVLTCSVCEQSISEEDFWEQDNDGRVFHPSCEEQKNA